jgi:hypothetical protein
VREKVALGAEILRLYVAVRIQLRRRPLPEVLARVRGRPSGSSRVMSPGRLARAVEMTLRLMPRDASCLVKSVVLVGLLARRSTPSTLVIGVLPGEELAAHAWVELPGGPLRGAVQRGYARLTEL